MKRSMPMMHIEVSGKTVVTKDFISGREYQSNVFMTLEDRIREHPRELLQKLINENTYHHHKKICGKCIDRLCELGQYAVVADMLKVILSSK